MTRLRHSCAGRSHLSHVFDTDELIGTQIGRYRIDARIGRGGMGVLYRAEHTGLGRTAALKVIAPELANDREYRRRFEREARMAAAIEHPNVVPVWDFADDRGRLFLAMRFVDGPDLGEVIVREGPMAPARGAAIVAQAAAGLDAAHARGLVHRDVKPGNILIERGRAGDHAWVTDFGLARASAISRTDLTRHGTVLGTLDFIAPEQLEDRSVDGRADVYALGCVLFYVLSGHVPFPRHNDAQRMKAHLLEPPRGIPVPQLQQAFNPVLARALAKRPEDRFQHAGELGAAVLDAARRVGPTAAQAGPPQPQAPGSRPRTPVNRPPVARTPPPATPARPAPTPRQTAAPATGPRRSTPRPVVLAAGLLAVLALVVGAVVAGGGLAGGDGRDPTPTPSGPSTAGEAGVAETEAASLLDQFESSFESEDSESLLGLMTPDAVWDIDGVSEDPTQQGIKGTFDEIFTTWREPTVEWSKVGFTPGHGDEPASMRADMRMSDGDEFDHVWPVEVEFVRFGDDARISRLVETSE